MYQRERPLLPAFITLGLMGALATAHAQTPVSHATGSPAVSDTLRECFGDPITRVYVPMTGGRFQIAMPPGDVAFVRIAHPTPLSNAIATPHGLNIYQYNPHSIVLTSSSPLKPGDTRNTMLLAGDLSVSMEVAITRKTRPAPVVELVPLPTKDFERHKAEAQAKEAERARERNPSIMRDYRHSVALNLLSLKEQRPSSPRMAGLDAPVAIRYAPQGEVRAVLTRLLESRGFHYLEVVLDNRRSRKLKIESAWIAEGDDDAVPVDVILDDTARTTDGLLAIIPAGRTTRGMVIVPPDVSASLDQLRVGFRTPSVTELVAQEVVELWPRMPEHIAKRRRWAKQVAVSVRGLYGGFWMGPGTGAMAEQSDMDGTSAGGLSVRIAKGMHHNFVFEGEFVGGRTGDAVFRNVTWATMRGDVRRRAQFGRLQAAGVIRFGRRYVISTRLGVGVQGTDYASAFTTGDTTMDGPGGSFEIDGVWSVGAAFDARLGEHWTLGAGATFAGLFYTGSRSLDAGVQLGYRWSL